MASAFVVEMLGSGVAVSELAKPNHDGFKPETRMVPLVKAANFADELFGANQRLLKIRDDLVTENARLKTELAKRKEAKA